MPEIEIELHVLRERHAEDLLLPARLVYIRAREEAQQIVRKIQIRIEPKVIGFAGIPSIEARVVIEIPGRPDNKLRLDRIVQVLVLADGHLHTVCNISRPDITYSEDRDAIF